MSSLTDIHIKVQTPGGDSNARAVLREIEGLLEQLLATGKGASIDLGGLPLTAEDYELLESSLGKGEVSAVVDTLGPTDVIETALPGVWWVTHCNTAEEVMAEFIEVSYCPEILQTAQDEVSDGLQRLSATLMKGDDNAG
jgi:hydrogenase-1 operon protein HyaF